MSMTKTPVLVAYAGRDRTTRRIAEVIGETLQATGLAPHVRAVTEVGDVTPYSAVILGSEVRNLGWRRTAVRFGRRHQRALRDRPVWLFSSDPIMHPISVIGLPGRRAARLANRLQARGHALFTARFEWDAHSSGGYWSLPGDGSGGQRDFAWVRAWALQVASDLGGDTVHLPESPSPPLPEPLDRDRAPLTLYRLRL